MNLLFLTIFTVASLSIFPTRIYGTTDEEVETPKALPLATNTKEILSDKNDVKIIEETSSNFKPSETVAELNRGGEVWKENEHEVDILIRNERGAKNNNNNGAASGTSGKKEKNKKKDKQNKGHTPTTTDIQTDSQTQNLNNNNNNNKKMSEPKIDDQCKFEIFFFILKALSY